MVETDFWAPRNALLERIPELEIAVDFLSRAADHLLTGDPDAARELIKQADMRVLRNFTARAISSESHEVHRLRKVERLPLQLADGPRRPRQPSEAEKANVFRRDGYRCRYCGCRIVVPKAQSVLHKALPGAVAWGNKDIELNAGFYTLKGVLDHVVPYAHNGQSDADNLVSSCQPCNYGKGNYFCDELGLEDPRLRPPIIDGWDGLTRLLAYRPIRGTLPVLPSASQRVAVSDASAASGRLRTSAAADINEWLSRIDANARPTVEQLISLLTECADLNISWTVGMTLAVHQTIRGVRLTLLGVLQDGEVQVPWHVGGHKAASRLFAGSLASAIPGAESYETPKMWRVRRYGRPLRVEEIIEAGSGLRDAFASTKTALRG